MRVLVAQDRHEQIADLECRRAHGQLGIAADGAQLSLNRRLDIRAEIACRIRAVRRAGNLRRANAKERSLQSGMAVLIADDTDDQLAQFFGRRFIGNLRKKPASQSSSCMDASSWPR